MASGRSGLFGAAAQLLRLGPPALRRRAVVPATPSSGPSARRGRSTRSAAAQLVDETLDGELAVAQLAALVLGDRPEHRTDPGDHTRAFCASLSAVEAATSNIASTLVDAFWAC